MRSTEFYLVLSGIPSFTEFYRILPNFTEFYRILPNFTEFYRVLPSFTEFYRVSSRLDLVLDSEETHRFVHSTTLAQPKVRAGQRNESPATFKRELKVT